MVLRAGEAQCIGCPQTEMAAKPRGLQVDRFRHVQWCELVEQFRIDTLWDRVAALDRPDQALAFYQRSDAKTRFLGLGDGACDGFAPPRMVLDEVNHQTGIEVDQSHALLSAAMAASISSAERRA